MSATPTSEDAPNNLPLQLSTFVGRTSEMKRVREALARGRLVTITGAGGTGKTRLAIEVARGLPAAPSSGEWFVALAPISDGSLVPQAVATVLGVTEAPGRPIVDAIIANLSRKQLLIVLDNCEQVIDACAEVAEGLLRACPGVSILATSRERLRIDGETVFPLASLEIPGAEGQTDAEHAGGFESVQLFLDRARAIQPGFELSAARAALMASICRRLDGMPLAIELAAARLGTLSLQEIDRRLGESLGVLTGGSRTAPQRQRTLNAAIEWSYDLLDKQERAVFRRLAVFQGGWTPGAAEGVCAGGGVDSGEVADLLGGLVEKSLVLAVEQRDGELRYRLLEPLRQFGQEKMAAAGEVEPTLDRHAEWFGELAARMETTVFGHSQIATFERIDLEMNNFRAALAWAIERPERISAGIRIVRVLAPIWTTTSNTTEGRRWIERLIEAARAAGHPKTYVLLLRLGLVAGAQMDTTDATRALEEGIKLARAAEDDDAIRTGLTFVTLRYFLQHRTDDAFAAAEEAVEISRRLGDNLGLARTLGSLAVATAARHGAKAALVIFEEAIVRARASGDRLALNGNLNNAADLERAQGLYDAAQAHYEEARIHLLEIGGGTWLVINSLNLGLLAIARGDAAGSVPFLREALERARTAGVHSASACTLVALAASSEAHTAATLLGAGHGIKARLDETSDPNDIATLEQIEGATREKLSAAEFDAAYAVGQAMSLEDAIEMGLSVANGGVQSAAGNEGSAGSAAPAPELQLTAREMETLRLLASGLSNKEIATEMVVSVRTVENHVANLYGKIGARGRADATAFALTHGLMDGVV